MGLLVIAKNLVKFMCLLTMINIVSRVDLLLIKNKKQAVFAIPGRERIMILNGLNRFGRGVLPLAELRRLI